MIERRHYVRMRTVFPVELQIGRDRLLQGFTRDVSAGGLCVELKSFVVEDERSMLAPDAALELAVNPPFSHHPIRAGAKIVWFRKVSEPLPERYFLGMAYTRIDEAARARLIRYAKRLLWMPRIAAVLGLVMLGLLAGLFVHEQRLIHENKKLVRELVESAQQRSDITVQLEELEKRKGMLEAALAEAQQKMRSFEGALLTFGKERTRILERAERLGAELKKLEAGKTELAARYRVLRDQEASRAPDFYRQMADWLRWHQNLRTGLVASFEGDRSLEDTAFTYDQSLACQVFLLFNSAEKAEAVLAFYETRAWKEGGAFFNAYNTVDGSPVESVVQTGPNVWIGIAALQCERRRKDGRFLPLARSVGDWLLGAQDAEGGLKGGPGFSWYSTEHNLDAYAFFRMLSDATGEARYAAARDKTLDWIRKYAYSVKERRLNRGKGDATIATDTFAWAIAAIGPQTLLEIGFDPEAIIEFAEKNCEVEVDHPHPDGKTSKVRGFDFAKAGHLGRGGIISTEWTAQMIAAYKILAGYFASGGDSEKAARYAQKADFYLNELQKLVITSPSRTGQGRGCLPYASIDNADTGHGWRTPKGLRTGSVAGTAYGLFAWLGYNPFSLENGQSGNS